MDKDALRSALMSAIDALGSVRDDDPKEIIQAVADAETQVIEAEAKAQADAQTQVIEAAAGAQGDAQEKVVEAKAQADADAQEQIIRAEADTTVDFVQDINEVQAEPEPETVPSDPLLLADTPELDGAGNIIGDGAAAADRLGDFVEQPGDPNEPLSDSVTIGETGRASSGGDAVDVLEGLISDSEDVVDIAPSPTHWYTRQRSFRRSRR